MKGTVGLLLLMCALLLLGPLAIHTDPMTTDTEAALQPPSALYPLGTDRLGRDMLSRLVYGGQRTVILGLVATLLAVGPGSAIGVFMAQSQGWQGRILTSIVNALLAIPSLLVALVVLTVAGTGLWQVATATGVALLAQAIRLTHGAALSALSMPYIESARATGATEFQIVQAHVVPNIVPNMLAITAVIFAFSVLNSAALSFLGLSGDLGVPDWGTMLFEGRLTLRTAPWTSLAPGVAITLLIAAANRTAVVLQKRGIPNRR